MMSADAIVQASATMIAGVFFLIPLRKALGLEITQNFFSWFSGIIALFAVAGALAVFGEEAAIAEGYPAGSMWWLATVLFVLGMFSLAFLVLYFSREMDLKGKKR